MTQAAAKPQRTACEFCGSRDRLVHFVRGFGGKTDSLTAACRDQAACEADTLRLSKAAG